MTDTVETRRAGPLAVAAATLAGNVYLFAGTLAFATLALLVVWVPPRGRWFAEVARLWARGALRAAGVEVRVTREAELDPEGRYVFVANHQSLFDVPALLATLPGEVRFLAKASLFRIPLLGWAMRAGGFVPVERDDRARARASFASAVAQLERGGSVLIFPESERSLDGSVLPFRRGGLLLARKCGLPVVPVGLEGLIDVQHRRSFLIRPGRVDIRYGRPVDLAGEPVRRVREWIRAVRARVAELAHAELAPGPNGARAEIERDDQDG